MSRRRAGARFRSVGLVLDCDRPVGRGWAEGFAAGVKIGVKVAQGDPLTIRHLEALQRMFDDLDDGDDAN